MSASSALKPRRTLGLMGITIHAMALIAPGAFIWLLFPLQLSAAGAGQPGGGLVDIWPGVLVALLTAFLTAAAFTGLARRYPQAGAYSAYHFAQRVFGELSPDGHSAWSRLMKFLTGWAAHLFYWVYPGVMIAFLTTLLDYILRQFGYQPRPFGLVLIALSLAAFVGFLALRGITGSMTSSILLNVLQLVILVAFCSLAIIFRVVNPLGIQAGEWLSPGPAAFLLPQELRGVLLQAALSILLVVGFESIVSSGVAAENPQRDISRGLIVTLVVQGFLAYFFQYFAFQFALTTRAFSAAGVSASGAPLGDLAILIGDSLLMGNGFALMMVAAFTVMVAVLAASLTSMNTGVRITFAMAVDADMPGFLSLLHEKHATPYSAVIALSVVSGLIGSLGAVGGKAMLAGITLAANLGAFLLYAMICAMAFLIYRKYRLSYHWKDSVFAGLGLVMNLFLAGVIGWAAMRAGGLVQQAAGIAFIVALVWLVANVVLTFAKRAARSG
jgi:amino acid transporter